MPWAPGRTVLVVEPNTRLRRELSSVLERAGYAARPASDDASAAAELAEGRPIAIVLDLDLAAAQSGLLLCSRLKSECRCPILALSGRNHDPHLVVAALDAGADDFLIRPVPPVELLARLRAALRRTSDSPLPTPSRIIAGEVEIDFSQRSIFRNQKRLPLTRREFDILACLARRLNQVTRVETILPEVWGYPHGDYIQTLRVHIGHLRRKLADGDSPGPRIITESGVGYRLDATAPQPLWYPGSVAKLTPLDEALHGYLVEHSTQEDALLAELRRETASRFGDHARMQISPDQGIFLGHLVAAMGARRVLEVGVFTGYSSLSIARRLPPDGRLLACDVSQDYTSLAKSYWERAGVADRIELRLGPALETLQALPLEPTLDFAFIDADKTNYRNYYEEILPRVRVNGLIALDNVLWHGRVVDSEDQSEDTRAIRQINDLVVADGRVEVVMLHVSDGLTLARKL